MRAYSDPRRESDPYTLSDVEVWQDRVYVVTCERCGDFDVNEDRATAEAQAYCPSCDREATAEPASPERFAWWWWWCFPGCMPDSDPVGPFETAEDALADAREGVSDDFE